MARTEGTSVVLGATGAIGSTVVDELSRQGRAVRALSRRPGPARDGVEPIAADVTDRDGLRRALDGAAAVYLCAQPPYSEWVTQFVPMVRSVVDAVADSGAVLVYADNLYGYGEADGPMRESTPVRPTTPKGRVRAEAAQLVFEAHASGRIRAVAARASDYFGPRGEATVNGPRTFGAVVAGKPATWLGSLDVPHTMSYLEDIARALVLLGGRPDAWGRAWHVPSPTQTPREFLSRVHELAGLPPRIRSTGRRMLAVGALFIPEAREVREMFYQFDRPFVMDSSDFGRLLGPFEPTPLDDAIGRTLAWWRSRPTN